MIQRESFENEIKLFLLASRREGVILFGKLEHKNYIALKIVWDKRREFAKEVLKLPVPLHDFTLSSCI